MQWAAAYLGVAWATLEALSLASDSFGWPSFFMRLAWVVLSAGFLSVLVLAWYHGERGRQRPTWGEVGLLAACVVLGGVGVAVVGVGEDVTELDRFAGPRLTDLDPRHVAVLPFDNLSPGGDSAQYLVDGIHDEILTQVSKISDLKVSSRTSVLRYREVPATLEQIAMELGVATLMEGTVTLAGDSVRIRTRLIDARSDTQLWEHEYQRTFADIFAIQSDVARQTAVTLGVELTSDEQGRIARLPTEDVDAYTLYLQARHQWDRATSDGLQRAEQLFRQAIERDSTFALAHVGLAQVSLIAGQLEGLPYAEHLARVRTVAQRALELDSTLADAHLVFALTVGVGDEHAARAFERALELNPSSAMAYVWYAQFLSETGRHDEAIEAIMRARALDPFSEFVLVNVPWRYYFAGRYEEALEEGQAVLERLPDHWVAHWGYGAIQFQRGRIDEALSSLGQAAEVGGPDPLAFYGHALAAAGREDEAREILQRLREGASDGQVSAYNIALVHLGLGEREAALSWLEEAYRQSAFQLRWLASEPLWEPLNEEPRMQAVLEQLGLADAASEPVSGS